MTRVHGAPRPRLEAIHGLLGGAVAGIVGLAAATAFALWKGAAAPVAANAVGAWGVRWLQAAAPQALDNVYADATAGGALTVVAAGGLLGAVFAALVARSPDDHPLAWGIVLGFAGWATVRWALAPALDPLLLRAVPPAALLVGHLAFGVALGGWVAVGVRGRRGA